MAINESDRHHLYDTVGRQFGDRAADTLMALLPPVGWADVVTKDYLDIKIESMEHRLESTENRILATVRAEMNHQTRTVVLSTVGSYVAMTGLVLGVLVLK